MFSQLMTYFGINRNGNTKGLTANERRRQKAQAANERRRQQAQD